MDESIGDVSTKIHATVDAFGNPTSFVLTPGRKHDLEGADLLLPDLKAEAVLADKGYDANKRVIKPLLVKGKVPIIPSRNYKKMREYDSHIYKSRHLMRLFGTRTLTLFHSFF